MGALNALFFLPLMLADKNRRHIGNMAENRTLPGAKEFLRILFTFALTLVAWVFFRAESVKDALLYLSGIFSRTLFTAPEVLPIELLIFITVLITAEWLQREKQHALQFDGIPIPGPVKWAVYYSTIATIMVFGGSQQQFIYFQF